MNFVTIDFETATEERDSPCEIALTFVQNSEIVETKSWLIKPHHYPFFNDFNVSIHGIEPEHVADQPEFNEIWHEIEPLIQGQILIAHNAAFDFSVLRKTLDFYSLPYPNLQYTCSYIFSKRVWLGLSAYDLKTLCRVNGIDFVHHRAAPDSHATAQLALKAFELMGISHFDEFPEKLKTKIGQLHIGGYKPSESIRENKEIIIVGNPEKNKPESIFFGKNVVFTGTLSSMVRHEAQQIIADIGGIIEKGVTKNTDYLVVGQQDYKVVGDDGMSNKQEKAVKMIAKGASLEVISELDFLQNI